jgi:hypothetical protein
LPRGVRDVLHIPIISIFTTDINGWSFVHMLSGFMTKCVLFDTMFDVQ